MISSIICYSSKVKTTQMSITWWMNKQNRLYISTQNIIYYLAIKTNKVLAHAGLPPWLSGKESTCNAGDSGSIHPWVGKIRWRRAWRPTPVFLSGKSHGQRSPARDSPWGRKTRRRLSTHTLTYAATWMIPENIKQIPRIWKSPEKANL